ncbi:Tn3 family transposase [Streptomyces olivaceoviridis]|uniref:Tn3 family transposase n=1 Tax=Streptomyces olivaceoviridis TaxID=1921 RepID=UPI0036797B06
MNAAVLFTTRHMNAALDQSRAGGHQVREEDVARLSPFVRHHIDMYLDTPRAPGTRGRRGRHGHAECRDGGDSARPGRGRLERAAARRRGPRSTAHPRGTDGRAAPAGGPDGRRPAARRPARDFRHQAPSAARDPQRVPAS